MSIKIENKVALVTGASRGLGIAIALFLGRAGERQVRELGGTTEERKYRFGCE